jgi:hypothetical protein
MKSGGVELSDADDYKVEEKFFSFNPLLFSDDIYNVVDDYLSDGADALDRQIKNVRTTAEPHALTVIILSRNRKSAWTKKLHTAQKSTLSIRSAQHLLSFDSGYEFISVFIITPGHGQSIDPASRRVR